MPHDRKGRLIEPGDYVKVKAGYPERLTVARVSNVTPGAETCNAQGAHLVPGFFPVQPLTFTARDCELVLKADGTEPAE